MIWIGWQAAGQTALDWDYFAYALVPSCFVGMAGLLKLAWREPYERHPLLIAVATAAALALSLSGAVETVVHPIEAAVGGVIMPAAGLVFGVAFAAAFLRPATAALPAFVIAFALANRIAAPGAPANYAVTDPCKTRPDIYEAIVDASTWLDSIDPTYTRVRTWFDDRERLALGPDGCSVGAGDIGQSVTSMAFSQSIVNRIRPAMSHSTPSRRCPMVSRSSRSSLRPHGRGRCGTRGWASWAWRSARSAGTVSGCAIRVSWSTPGSSNSRRPKASCSDHS